jgi:hypothetical protein
VHARLDQAALRGPIVGGGQGAIGLDARLRMLDVLTFIVEKERMAGRQRAQRLQIVLPANLDNPLQTGRAIRF